MIENQYEKRIQEIFSRYCNPPQFSTHELLRNKVFSFAQEQNGAPWAIFGAGMLTRELLGEVDLSSLSGLQGIFDNNKTLWGSDFLGTKILNPEKVTELGIKKIITCTHKSHPQIQAQFASLDPSVLVIDILEDLLSYDGYALGVSVVHHDTSHMIEQEKATQIAYTDLYFFKRLYDISTDEEEKKKLLSYQIDTYIWIRDFVNGFEFIDLYVSLYGCGQYDLLKKELESLLADLKETLKTRESNDILLVLLDSLPSIQFYGNEEFSYLQSLAKEGTSYTKAYSPGIFTSESLSAMWRKVPVVHLRAEEGSMDTPLKEILSKHGYSSSVAYTRKIKKIPPKDVEPQQFYEDGVLFQETSMEETLPQQYWAALTSFASEQGAHFFMIHSINETHEPFYCGRFQKDVDVIPKNKVAYSGEALQSFLDLRFSDVFSYVDAQSEFYLSMLSHQTKKVFFADHGNHYETIFSLNDPEKTPRRYSESFHIPFFLHGGDIEQKEVSTLFSTIYLTDVLEGLIDGVTKPPQPDHVQIGLMAFRLEYLINTWIEKGYGYEVSGLNIVLDEEYKMVRNGKGACLYYAMTKEGTDLHDPELIAMIQERLGHFFKHKEYFK